MVNVLGEINNGLLYYFKINYFERPALKIFSNKWLFVLVGLRCFFKG